MYLMKNDKCSCDKGQNLKFVRALLILPHMVQLYYEDVELDVNIWRLRPLW